MSVHECGASRFHDEYEAVLGVQRSDLTVSVPYETPKKLAFRTLLTVLSQISFPFSDQKVRVIGRFSGTKVPSGEARHGERQLPF